MNEDRPPSDPALALLEELNLGSACGARRPAADLEIEIVRPLTEADLPALLDPETVKASLPQLAKIRHSHHQLAQVMVRGVTDSEASLITGYGPGTIWRLKQDPAFQELLAHYGQEREAVFVDVLERMKVLGLSTLDELQTRLEEDPEGWSRRELMEMAELMILKPQQSRTGAGSGSGGPAVSVNVKFVTAQQAQTSDRTLDSVDVKFEDLFEDGGPE